ncbi:hypothetical protein, partial [uncultured Legionella sp.]|uniref:hypothetical protein n=1 Tax=uncultured Legionella sp. TaxID=210934 RepID=UPI002626E0E1
MDKKRKSIVPIHLNTTKRMAEHADANTLERTLISKLINNGQNEFTIHDLAYYVLKLFSSHPSLKNKVI